MPKITKEAAWERLDSSEIANCEKCHIKIWKYWHDIPKSTQDKDSSYPLMTLCGPCLFGYK